MFAPQSDDNSSSEVARSTCVVGQAGAVGVTSPLRRYRVVIVELALRGRTIWSMGVFADTRALTLSVSLPKTFIPLHCWSIPFQRPKRFPNSMASGISRKGNVLLNKQCTSHGGLPLSLGGAVFCMLLQAQAASASSLLTSRRPSKKRAPRMIWPMPPARATEQCSPHPQGAQVCHG